MECMSNPGSIMVRCVTETQKKPEKTSSSEIIFANEGDCHAALLKPLTFVRQVIALCCDQTLMDHPCFPDDAKRRASDILDSCAGRSIGSYPTCTGLAVVRRHVAQFIESRDGISSHFEDCFIFPGVSCALENVIKLVKGPKEGKRSGVMIPVPGHPLYFDVLSILGLDRINYDLDEDSSWEVKPEELKRSIEKSRLISNPRAIVVINPGNPTGSVLTRENMEEIIKFAFNDRLLLLADEIYQDNVYQGAKFLSFKKVMTEMGEPYKSMELVSFMSASKGYSNEGGLRGGFAEIVNFEPEVKDMISKYIMNTSCPSQIAIDCIVKPPQNGDSSHSTYLKEITEIRESLEEKRLLMEKLFKRMEGVKHNPIKGGLYTFPQLILPDKAVLKAKSLGQEADYFYAMQLLERTGIHVTPGCVLGQKQGTHHLKICIVVPKDKLFTKMKRLEEFHNKFLEAFK